MKKSEVYKEAQVCVLIADHLNEYKKLEILRELMASENLALFREKQEEENKAVEHETV